MYINGIFNMNKYFAFRRDIMNKISKIPKKNKAKFTADYIKLIELAQKENYNEIEIPEN